MRGIGYVRVTSYSFSSQAAGGEMGTYVSGAIAVGCSVQTEAIGTEAAALLERHGVREAILSRVPVTLDDLSGVWYAATNRKGYTADECGDIGEIISRLGRCRVLWLHYSDSTGRSVFRLFESGKLIKESLPNAEPRAVFFEAARIVSSSSRLVQPEDLVDILQTSREPGEHFWIVREYRVVVPPVRYENQSESPSRVELLDREFERLKPARAVFRVGVWVFGGTMLLGILAVIVWFAIEVFFR